MKRNVWLTVHGEQQYEGMSADSSDLRVRGTEEKTYLIAQRCGYEDPNYFSYVFKRHFGVTPTKYRSEGK